MKGFSVVNLQNMAQPGFRGASQIDPLRWETVTPGTEALNSLLRTMALRPDFKSAPRQLLFLLNLNVLFNFKQKQKQELYGTAL